MLEQSKGAVGLELEQKEWQSRGSGEAEGVVEQCNDGVGVQLGWREMEQEDW